LTAEADLHIHLTVDAAWLSLFYEFLAAGFRVPVVVETASIREVLIEQVGLNKTYLEKNIQTVFLNGRAVDDFVTTTVSDGDVMALSAAMPGLVGAVFRRQSPLSNMRSNMSDDRHPSRRPAMEGWITLKLFNRVASDIGPDLLAGGIRVTADRLACFMESHADFRCEHIVINGEEAGLGDIAAMKNSTADIQLSVTPA